MLFRTILLFCGIATVTVEKSGDVCWSDGGCTPNGICAHIDGNGVCVCRVNRMDGDGYCLPDDVALGDANDGDRGAGDSDVTTPAVAQAASGTTLCPNLYFGGIKVPEHNRNCVNDGVCTQVNSTLSVCVCTHGWFGKTCSRRLLRKENVVADNPQKVKGMKYENLQSFAANILGTHFAQDADECIDLCVATNGVCKSANFGSYEEGNYICEMLGLVTTKGDFMDKAGYHVKADGWTYVYNDEKNKAGNKK